MTTSAASAGPAPIESPAFEVALAKAHWPRRVIGRLPNFVRFSADQIVRDKHGLYGHRLLRATSTPGTWTTARGADQDGPGGAHQGTARATPRFVEDAGRAVGLLVFLDADKELPALESRIQGRRAARDSILVESGARDGRLGV
ncbi:hypothetical protein MY11210_003613 [Beauveria gryllotalpidicola]